MRQSFRWTAYLISSLTASRTADSANDATVVGVQYGTVTIPRFSFICRLYASCAHARAFSIISGLGLVIARPPLHSPGIELNEPGRASPRRQSLARSTACCRRQGGFCRESDPLRG